MKNKTKKLTVKDVNSVIKEKLHLYPKRQQKQITEVIEYVADKIRIKQPKLVQINYDPNPLSMKHLSEMVRISIKWDSGIIFSFVLAPSIKIFEFSACKEESEKNRVRYYPYADDFPCMVYLYDLTGKAQKFWAYSYKVYKTEKVWLKAKKMRTSKLGNLMYGYE